MTSRRIQRVLLAAAACAHASVAFGQTSGTWAVDVGTGGGSWSVASNWQGGIIPNNGGTATFTAVPFSAAPVAIFQDLPSVTLDQINYLTYIFYNLRAPAASPTNAITLTGGAVINNPLQSINTLATSTFGQLIQMPVAGSAGLTKRGPGTVTLWQNTNTYTGGTRVEDGVLVLRQIGDAGLGDVSGGVTLDGGTIRATTGAWTSSRAITLGAGGGTIDATNTGTTIFNGAVGGNGSLNKIGGRGLTLTAANGYTGATNVLAGSIGLSGDGALTATSAVTVRDSLVLDNSGTNSSNRINNNAPIRLHGAAVSFSGNASIGTGENLGTVTFSRGTSTITATASAGHSAAIVFADVNREIGGTAFIRGSSLGGAPGPGTANVFFNLGTPMVGGNGGLGDTDIAIIPWVIANSDPAAAINSLTTSFATSFIGGVRPLDISTEYVSSFGAAGPTDNVRLIASDSVSAPKTVNSLIITGSGLITGSSTLTVTSGAVMNPATARIDCNLDFGAREAIFFAHGSLALNGAIGGTGGVTKQGAGVATFAAANTYTGQTVLGGGTTVFTSGITNTGAPSPFGSDTSAVVLAPAGIGTGNTTARLVYVTGGSVSFDRDLQVTGRVAVGNAATLPGFGVNGASTLTMNGDIILDGSPLSLIGNSASSLVIVNGDISGAGPLTDGTSNGGTVRLNGDNSYTEATEMGGGLMWEIGSDTALGTGMIKVVGAGAGRIQAVNGPRTLANPIVSFSTNFGSYWHVVGSEDITFTGDMNLSGSYTHNINNAGLTTYAGELHTGGLTKAGTGVLVLSGNNTYTGVTTISSGVLRVTHANALGLASARTVVNSGAALQLSGGVLTTETLTISGTGIGGTGALVSLSGVNSVGDVALAANALIRVDAGRLIAGDVDAPTTTLGLDVSGGPLTADRVRVGPLTVNGQLAIAPGRSTARTSRVSSVSLGATSSVDLGDNDLVVDYTGSSPEPGIRGLLAAGHNGGSWDGNGLKSAAAAANPSAALGYAASTDVFSTFPAVFSGQDVDDSSVLVRYTVYGDSDLSGTTDIDDFGLLASSFNVATNSWYRGDYNYSGTTDIDDFALLATNFNQSISAGLAGRPAAVPEPAAAFLGLAGGFLRRRRG